MKCKWFIFIPYKLYYYYFKILNILRFKLQNIKLDNDFIGMGLIQVYNRGICKIGKEFKFNSGKKYNPIGGDTILRLIIGQNAILTIGNNVGISNSTIFSSFEIEIGNNVLIGGGCKIWDSDFHSLNPVVRLTNDNCINMKKVRICDNVFVGGGSIILKGVTIGENSIIGAGSIISRNIPENQIWAGNPAKFIKNVDVNDK